MAAIDWALAGSVLLKLGLAALLGGIVGYERELNGRPAGVRTHMMLILGVTLFSEVSKVFAVSDQDRIAAQIVTGVGFLGAGTIMRLGAEIKGLTSAASLWAVSAIGMAVSVGGTFFVVAIVATLLAMFTLSVVDKIERQLVPNAHPRALSLTLTARENLSIVIESVEKAGGKVMGVRLLGSDGLNAQMDVQGRHADVMASAVGCQGVVSASWQD